MTYSILALLKLQEFELLKAEANTKGIYLTVKRRRKTADCPGCGKRTPHVWQHGKYQRIKHLSLGKRQIWLRLQKRRFLCKECQLVFTERLWLVKPWARRTTVLDQEIITDLADLSFKTVSKRTTVSYHSQAKILKQEINPFIGNWQEEEHQEEISLGIDEISFAGLDFLPTIANLTTRRLKAVLANNSARALEQCLRNIPAKIKSKIKEVCVDMNRRNIAVIKRVLPKAKVIIDHFHVIQDANRRITEERRITQQVFKVKLPMRLFLKNRENLKPEERARINQYFQLYQDLRFYWEAKEALREMYTFQDKAKAKRKLETLIAALTDADNLGLRQWARSLSFYQEEILNFFDRRTTNAYLEGVNNKLKLVKRISFGFRNKDVFIRKAILSCLPLSFLPQLLT